MTKCGGCSRLVFTELDAHAFAHFGIEPLADGRVRYAGVLWRGLPYPHRIRFILRAKLRGHRIRNIRKAAAKFAGCGCIDRLKRWTEGKR